MLNNVLYIQGQPSALYGVVVLFSVHLTYLGLMLLSSLWNHPRHFLGYCTTQ